MLGGYAAVERFVRCAHYGSQFPAGGYAAGLPVWIPENPELPENLEPPENPRTPTPEPQGSGASEPLTFNIQQQTASERSDRATALGGTGGGNNQQVISIDWGFVLEWWYE